MSLARKPYVIIDAEILSSSIWCERPHVKLVWLTLLVLCDLDGYVGASVPGIASAAGVSLAEAQEALALFMAPDRHSRTEANEGRRLEKVERGFRVLNFRQHLDLLSVERARARERVRRFREKKRGRKSLPTLQDAPVTAGNVTGNAGSREQVIGNSEEGENGSANSAPAKPSIEDYGRAILEVWRERKGNPDQGISPSEFMVVRRWYDAGIPVRVVAMGLRQCRGEGKTLGYYDGAVMDEARRAARAMNL